METLFLIGSAIFLGMFGGEGARRFKIPQVVGYIIVGILLGSSALKFLQSEALNTFTPLVDFTLGIIGFLIGAELKSEIFRKYGRSIYLILISEGMSAFILVFVAVTLITKKVYLGLLLGAIASATDPASTVNVLWEYKSRGPLTTTLTSIVALDDGLALILYALVSVFSRGMITNQSSSLWSYIGLPLLELTKCLGLGAVAGIVLVNLIRRFNKEMRLVAILAIVAVIVGLAIYLHLDLILTSMVMGAVVANVIPKMTEEVFKKVKELTTPLYIFFFVFVGASLDIHVFLQLAVISIVIAYLVSRSAGKIFGAMFGGYLAKAKKVVSRYCGLCLFTQGGVAIGLAMSIAHNLRSLGQEGSNAGVIIINVVAATTFVVQLIGPIFVKFGVIKAGEAGRNVTEEDIIENLKVSDVMSKDFVSIKENYSLDKIMEVIKETESYYFPVVNHKNEFSGVISLGTLRNVFMEEQLNPIILAKNVANSVGMVLYQDQPLKEAFEIFNRRGIDYLPVVKDKHSKEVVGGLTYHLLVEIVNRKTLERQGEFR